MYPLVAGNWGGMIERAALLVREGPSTEGRKRPAQREAVGAVPETKKVVACEYALACLLLLVV